MKGSFSPMEDSTPTERSERQARQRQALEDAIQSVSDCEIFDDTLIEYQVAGVLVDSMHDDETVLRPAAGLITWAARNMVVAAADYHCARIIFAAQKALLALEREEA
jgi:hypothetical protein